MKESIVNLLKGKDKQNLGNNTIIYRYSPNEIDIRLHDTDILCFIDDSVILNNDGWFSSTTRNRMNKYLREFGYSIFQKCPASENCRKNHTNRDHKWFLRHFRVNITVPYKNGMSRIIFTDEEWAREMAPIPFAQYAKDLS